jgi:hypothetical protein
MLWDTVTFAKKYQIQIASDTLFKTIIYSGDSKDDSSYVPSALEIDKKYFWKVRAIADKDTSDWSSIWSFTTNLGAAILISPPDSSVNLPLTDTLRWDAPKAANKFHLQVAKDLNFTNLIVDDSTLVLKKYEITGLETNTTYYWRAKFYINGIQGIWSLPWHFTTNVGNVTLVSPADSTINQPVTVDLVWSGPQFADKFNVQVSTDANFSNLIVNDTLKAFKRTVSGLQHNRQYRWRVRMFTGNIVSDFVPFWVFNTCVDTAVLVQPSKNQEEVDIKVTFKWNKADGAEFYLFQLATDKNFADMIYQKDSIVATETTYGTLDTGKVYYWRVKAKFKKIEAAWSELWTFATRGERIGVDEQYISETNDVAVFPNPFSGTTTIKYLVKDYEKVTLKIIDLSGFVIDVPVDAYQNAGIYEIRINPEKYGLSQGTYLYYITIGTKSKSGEMHYMK